MAPASPPALTPFPNPFALKEDGCPSVLPFVKVLKGSSNCIPRFADPHRLQHSRVAQLVQHNRLVKVVWHLQGAERRDVTKATPPPFCTHARVHATEPTHIKNLHDKKMSPPHVPTTWLQQPSPRQPCPSTSLLSFPRSFGKQAPDITPPYL